MCELHRRHRALVAIVLANQEDIEDTKNNAILWKNELCSVEQTALKTILLKVQIEEVQGELFTIGSSTWGVVIYAEANQMFVKQNT